MKLYLAACVLLGYFVHALVADQKGCSLTVVRGSSERDSPILLQSDSSALIVPTNGKVNLEEMETITLACPDTGNYLIQTETESAQAECIKEDILRLDGRVDISFYEIKCQKGQRGAVRKTEQKCASNKGKIFNIGYQITPRIFLSVIDVCYNSTLERALYSKHTVYGAALSRSDNLYRPRNICTAGVSNSIGILYFSQTSTFIELLKSSTLAKLYINFHNDSRLAHCRLSPERDLTYGPLQYTSLYYLNTVPQWKIIRDTNWKKLGLLIKQFAITRQETLTIATGVHKVLTLPDANGQEVGIYLWPSSRGNKLAVPKYIWKMVYSELQTKAIVFVILNNPFAATLEEGDVFCNNICNASKWNSPDWNDLAKGFIFCCTYTSFIKAVPIAPRFPSTGVLPGQIRRRNIDENSILLRGHEKC